MNKPELLEEKRKVMALILMPDNCERCGSRRIRHETTHFPRFFYSCEDCEKRMEVVQDPHKSYGVGK